MRSVDHSRAGLKLYHLVVSVRLFTLDQIYKFSYLLYSRGVSDLD